INSRLSELGYLDLLEFLATNQTLSYFEVANILARENDISPIQLEQLHVESTPENMRDDELYNSLVRFIRGALPKGWAVGSAWQGKLMGALGSWSVVWNEPKRTERIKRKLLNLKPARGWRPLSSSDPIITLLRNTSGFDK